jgi:hypothetical protein
MIRNGVRQPSTSSGTTASRRSPAEAESEVCQWSDPSTWPRFVENNPTTAVFVSLGVGFGVGVLVASLLEGPVRRWTQPESRNFAERVGHRVMETLHDVLPSRLFGRS